MDRIAASAYCWDGHSVSHDNTIYSAAVVSPVNVTVMRQRTVIGALAIGMALAVVVVDAWVSGTAPSSTILGSLLRHGSVLPITCAVLMSFAAAELVNLMREAGLRPLGKWSTGFCAALMISPWLGSAQWLGLKGAFEGPIIILLIAALGSAVRLVIRARPEHSIINLAVTWTVIVYMGFLPSFAMLIRCDSNESGLGAWKFLFFVIVAKASDIGAYFGGTFFGRKKLLPSVSPGKTVEGAIWAIISSVLVCLLLNHGLPIIMEQLFPTLYSMDFGKRILTLPQAVIFGIVISLVGQIGDLFESLFKRDARIKDSARLIPSYGGILDLVDSPVFAAPVAWFLLSVW